MLILVQSYYLKNDVTIVFCIINFVWKLRRIQLATDYNDRLNICDFSWFEVTVTDDWYVTHNHTDENIRTCLTDIKQYGRKFKI